MKKMLKLLYNVKTSVKFDSYPNLQCVKHF